MCNAKRRSLFVLLAFVGMVASLSEVNACWRKGRGQGKQSQCQEQYIIVESAVLATVISGVVYDIDGAVLLIAAQIAQPLLA